MKKKLLAIGILSVMLALTACGNTVEQTVVEQLSPEEEQALFEEARNLSIADDSITDEYIEIYSPEGLMSIPNGSSRNYVLSADIDMTGNEWAPIDFSGTFDGKGHSISNLFVSGHSQGLDLVYDGNMKVYQTRFCGMFGILDGAVVKDLTINNINYECATGEECVFSGSIAGFMSDALIDNVSVNGTGFLETSSKCFGIGGIAGYGKGEIRNSVANLTLICIDNDAEHRDEQFMGGVYAAGAIDLNNNSITIDGYDSDHGYVHNGGLVGMYIHYYDGCPKGSICGNTVDGRIKFFEDNTDRRAYCEAYVGEMMCWDLDMNKNSNTFTRDEVFEYNVNLMPEEN
ncbi:MAG: hypothetical protein Q4F55_01185 [Bacillota bacterium]|nr:hypothetical protein [Bacillota bacterium]